MPLRPRHARFVAEYLKDLNATQAAIRAGYKGTNAHVRGSQLLATAKIRAAVDEALAKREKKLELSAEWVLANIREVAQRCLQKVPVMVREGRDIVQKTTAEGEGVWEFDSSGANKSLELLGRHLGMFVERHQLSGPDGKAISITINGIAE